MKVELYQGRLFLLYTKSPDGTFVIYNGFDEEYARNIDDIIETVTDEDWKDFLGNESTFVLETWEQGEKVSTEIYLSGIWIEDEDAFKVNELFESKDDDDDEDQDLSEGIELFPGFIEVENEDD